MHTSTKIAARCVWYTPDTHGVKALQSYIYSYTALYSAVEYTAIHRYTLYTLYNTPLRKFQALCELREAISCARQ